MKRFIITVSGLLLLLAVFLYAVYYRGLYLDTDPDAPISVAFRTQGRDIQRLVNGSWESFEIRGVDLTSAVPCEFTSDYAGDTEDYLSWLESISDLGANCIRVFTIMDSDFYEAFYTFNTESGRTLYLLQGLQVPDAANYGAEDAYGSDFRELLIQNGQSAVDVIHGKKILPLGNTSGTGIYSRDISPWVLGYLVGHEWDSGNIAYTDKSTLNPQSYEGEYFSTTPEAGRFEALMAEIMDRITGYESDKYKTQRLIAFISDPSNDPFEYETLYATRFFKYNQLDAEHIVPGPGLKSGYFAAYRLSRFCTDFLDYLSPEQRLELGSILAGLDTSDYYNGYMDLLAKYHSIPVVAAGFGFSTARAPIYEGEEPLTEQEQGRNIVQVLQDTSRCGWAGAFVSSWQDVWQRKSWNTSYSNLDSILPMWQDMQSDGQSYGLMQFSLGQCPCYVDGEASEWTESDVVLETDLGSLSMKYDEKYIYFYARGFDPGTQALYIPIDTTPKSGSTYCQNYDISFERPCDFVICIHGEADSRVVVQERYDTLWAMHANEISRRDAYEQLRSADSPVFRNIELLVQRDQPAPVMLTQETWTPEPTYETGLLCFGNSNPDSPDFDSLADFMFTEDGVEIRIPWQLLNFSDPSEMLIHDDYYENYGVENLHIDEMWVGLAWGENAEYRIPMAAFELEGWDKEGSYLQRLKESYYILQKYWT